MSNRRKKRSEVKRLTRNAVLKQLSGTEFAVIEWRDAASAYGWCNILAPETCSTAQIVSVGVVVNIDEESVTLAQSFSFSDAEIVGNALTIPIPLIRKVVPLDAERNRSNKRLS